MKRQDFLKRLGVGIGTTLLAPRLLDGKEPAAKEAEQLQAPPNYEPMQAMSAVSASSYALPPGQRFVIDESGPKLVRSAQ